MKNLMDLILERAAWLWAIAAFIEASPVMRDGEPFERAAILFLAAIFIAISIKKE